MCEFEFLKKYIINKNQIFLKNQDHHSNLRQTKDTAPSNPKA